MNATTPQNKAGIRDQYRGPSIRLPNRKRVIPVRTCDNDIIWAVKRIRRGDEEEEKEL